MSKRLFDVVVAAAILILLAPVLLPVMVCAEGFLLSHTSEVVDIPAQDAVDYFIPELRPPEEWLLKAWDGDTLVDLIYCPKGLPVDDALIARGEELSVLGMDIRVMALEDVMATKLLALTEHSLRYESLLQIARALREQIDWQAVRARTLESPFARAFLFLAAELDLIGAPS